MYEGYQSHYFVSCSETASTLLMGDEIIAINDINVESVQELERCLGKVQKNEVGYKTFLMGFLHMKLVVFMQCWVSRARYGACLTKCNYLLLQNFL